MYRYRNMFKGIAFVMILVVLLMGISHVFTPKNNVKGFGMFDVKANGILGERDGSIDVLVLGDSEAYSAFSPMQIWDEKGIPMYVCATSGQHLYEAINFFEQALKKQKPKVVILETNAIFRKFSATDTIRNKVENNLGVFRYHDRWKSMTIGNMIKKSEYTWVDDYKGFYLIKDKKASTVKNHMKYTKSKAEIPEMNYKHVLEIKKLAEENGAKLILVSTPSTKNWNYKRHNSIAKMAKDENIEYIDMIAFLCLILAVYFVFL